MPSLNLTENRGLQLAQASLGLVIGYSVLSGAAFLAVVFVLACLWCISGRRARSRGVDGDNNGARHSNSYNNNRKSFGSRKTSRDSEPMVLPDNGYAAGHGERYE